MNDENETRSLDQVQSELAIAPQQVLGRYPQQQLGMYPKQELEQHQPA